jgi:hypothetical protein
MSNIAVWDSISSNGRLKLKAYCIKAQILPDWVTDVCIAVLIAHSLQFSCRVKIAFLATRRHLRGRREKNGARLVTG